MHPDSAMLPTSFPAALFQTKFRVCSGIIDSLIDLPQLRHRMLSSGHVIRHRRLCRGSAIRPGNPSSTALPRPSPSTEHAPWPPGPSAPVKATALACRVTSTALCCTWPPHPHRHRRPPDGVENGKPEHSKTTSNTTHQAHPRTQKPPPEPADGGSLTSHLLSQASHQQRRHTWTTQDANYNLCHVVPLSTATSCSGSCWRATRAAQLAWQAVQLAHGRRGRARRSGAVVSESTEDYPRPTAPGPGDGRPAERHRQTPAFGWLMPRSGPFTDQRSPDGSHSRHCSRSAPLSARYHQQTKNVLCSYSPKKLGFF